METVYLAECIPCTTEGETVLPDGSAPRPYQNPIEYAAFSGRNYTSSTPAFSLGSAYSQFHDGGLSESFYLTYPLSTSAAALEQSRTVFLRYLINDREPESENLYSVYGKADASGFRDEGRKFGLQHRDCSLLVYKPKQFEKRSISRMRLSVMIPCHFAEVEEVVIGGDSLGESRTHRTPRVQTIYVKDGAVVAAFVPLATTNHGGGGTVIERRGNYLYLSFVNYDGPARSFSEEELFQTQSGLVAHVKSAFDGWSIDRLRKHVEQYRLSDRMRSQLGGTIRWIRYGNDTEELEFAYSPRSEGIMVASINGRPRPTPVFRCSAIPDGSLPFLA